MRKKKMNSLEVFYEFFMETSCQGVYQKWREGMPWKPLETEGQSDTKSDTEHIFATALFTAVRGNVLL